jgi:transcriptional regulator with XRE-family HTH domain
MATPQRMIIKRTVEAAGRRRSTRTGRTGAHTSPKPQPVGEDSMTTARQTQPTTLLPETRERRKSKGGRPIAQSAINTYVGARVRDRRIILGLTQTQLGDLIDVTFQQIGKYESGANRIASNRLYDIATALGVDVGYLFEGMGDIFKSTVEAFLDEAEQCLILTLVQDFRRIGNPKHKRAVVKLVRALSKPN